MMIRNYNKSEAKPIGKKQLHLLKFGNYFSKSPKLTTNRIDNKHKNKSTTNRSSNEQKQSEQLFNNFAGTGLIVNNHRQISAESISTSNTMKRLSNSTEISTPTNHSNSNSPDNTSNAIYLTNETSDSQCPSLSHQQPSLNTRYRELIKEYVDTESTISSSDIQDDLSSVASDGTYI